MFQQEVTEKLPVNLEDIFDSWTKQTGYPILRVSRTGTDLRLELSNPSSHPFYVPINYALNSDLNFTSTEPDFWLGPSGMEAHMIPITSNGFAIFNKQQSGYYRVFYDFDSLQLITDHMLTKSGTIHAVNRAQLVDDVAHFAFHGQQEYHQFFDLINFIENESNYLPWLVLHRRLSEIHQRLKGHEGYDRFETYLREKTANEFERWGVGGITIRHRTRLLREAVTALACTAGNGRCVNESLSLVDKLVSPKISHLPRVSQL